MLMVDLLVDESIFLYDEYHIYKQMFYDLMSAVAAIDGKAGATD